MVLEKGPITQSVTMLQNIQGPWMLMRNCSHPIGVYIRQVMHIVCMYLYCSPKGFNFTSFAYSLSYLILT